MNGEKDEEKISKASFVVIQGMENVRALGGLVGFVKID